MNKKNNRKGFTIVELVIVIAVIAILATVLVPTFGGVISDANRTALVQELRNAYTSYTVEKADEPDYSDDIIIKLDNKYYEFKDGALVMQDDNKTPKEYTGNVTVYWDATKSQSATETSATNASSQST